MLFGNAIIESNVNNTGDTMSRYKDRFTKTREREYDFVIV